MTHEPPPTSSPTPPRTRWSFSRVARLGFLVGRGLDAKGVAVDPLIASTPNNVHRQVQRFGLAFREVGARLPRDVTRRLDAAANRRGLNRDGLIHMLLMAAGSDASLIDNILDDEA